MAEVTVEDRDKWDEVGEDTERLTCAGLGLDALPEVVGTLFSLKALDASGNRLKGVPEAVCACMELEELLLFSNAIKEIPAAFNGDHLPRLKTLNLYNNQLTKLPPQVGTLASLEEVNVAGNKLMVVGDEAMQGWEQVQVLSLYDNRIVRLGSLRPLGFLKELRLYGNNLETAPEVGDCPDLEVLEVHKNRIAEIPEDFFPKMPNLKRLVLSANLLTSLPESLAACRALQQVQVQENQLASLPAGVAAPGLETLFAQDNPLATLPPELAECGAMRRCNLANLPLDAPGKEVAAALKATTLGNKGGIFWDLTGAQVTA